MSSEGGGRRESQSKNEAISPQRSNIGEEKISQQSAETITAQTGKTTSDINQQSEQSSAASLTPLHRREGQEEGDSTRHVIAVSASKGPAAFFNLARKFLATDEMCDLSALEGAIVSAVDAAHLLERSKLATIERIQTSYVAVEPKRRKAPTAHISTATADSGAHIPQESLKSMPSTSVGTPTSTEKVGTETTPIQSTQVGKPTVALKQAASPTTVSRTKKSKGGTSSEVRRARIMITVKRTPEYKQWLLDNPIPDSSAGEEDSDADGISGTSMQPKS